MSEIRKLIDSSLEQHTYGGTNAVIAPSSNGVLALATTPTPSFATVTYTGNGTSQNIVTGLESSDPNWVSAGSYTAGDYIIHNYYIYQALTTHSSVATTPDLDTTNWSVVADGVSVPFLNSQVWIKERGNIAYNYLIDTIRGKGSSDSYKVLTSNETAAEWTAETGQVTSINSDGFSVGDNSDVSFYVNRVSQEYVAWQEQYDTMVSGTTNHGKRYITAYNAQSGKGMTIYVGSGVAGHEIPHGLGTKPDFLVTKGRTAISSWVTYNSIKGATEWMPLESTTASSALSTVWNDTEPTDSVYTLGSNTNLNTLDSNYVAYFSSNRDNHTVTKMYQGTGVAGNVVDLGLDMTQAGARIILKSLTGGVGSWLLFDNKRGLGTGATAEYVAADLSNAEATSTQVDMEFTSTGVILGNINTSVNASGYTYLIEATVPNYDKPTGGLDVPAGTRVQYAAGVSGINRTETLTLHSDITLIDSAKNFITAKYGDIISATDVQPLVGYSRVEADRWGSPVAGSNYRTTDKHSDYASATGVVSDLSPITSDKEGWTCFTNTTLVQNVTSGYMIASTNTGEVVYTFSEPRTIKSFRKGINFSNATLSTNIARESKDFSLYGSNDNGATWTLLSAQTGIVYTAQHEWSALFTVSDTTAYKQVKLASTANNGDATYTGFGRIELNTEAPKGDFYDVETKTFYDSLDTVKQQVLLGEVTTDGQGKVIPDTLIEYPAGNEDFADARFHGDVEFYGGFDLGQKWVDETANRLAEVTYKNETGKPIHVSVILNDSAAQTVFSTLYVNGVNISWVQLAGATNTYAVHSVVIPIDATYYISALGNDAIIKWSEYK